MAEHVTPRVHVSNRNTMDRTRAIDWRREVMRITGTMIPFFAQYGIFAIAALVLLSQVGIPLGVPAEVALLLAGSFVIHSTPALVFGLLILAAADIAGSTVLYAATRFGSSRLRLLRSGQTRAGRYVRYSHRRRLIAAIVMVRSLPMVRIYAAIGCGVARADLRVYLAGALPAALLWVGIPLTAGYLFRNDVRIVAERLGASSLLVGLVPALFALLFLVHARQRARRAD